MSKKTKTPKHVEFMRITEVSNTVQLSKPYLYKLIREGKFPNPIQLIPGTRTSAWIKSEVYEWMDNAVATARGAK